MSQLTAESLGPQILTTILVYDDESDRSGRTSPLIGTMRYCLTRHPIHPLLMATPFVDVKGGSYSSRSA